MVLTGQSGGASRAGEGYTAYGATELMLCPSEWMDVRLLDLQG